MKTPKPQKQRAVHIKINAVTHEKLKKLAKLKGMTMSGLIRYAVKDTYSIEIIA